MAAGVSGVSPLGSKQYAIQEMVELKTRADSARGSYLATNKDGDRRKWDLYTSQFAEKMLAYEKTYGDMESLAKGLYKTENERVKFLKLIEKMRDSERKRNDFSQARSGVRISTEALK